MRVALRTIGESSQPKSKQIEMVLNEGQKFSIGRAECQLVLADDKVSRRHLQLVVKDNRLLAEDLKSSNGTFYQGKKITVLPLKETDTLKLGKHTLVFDRIQSEEESVHVSIEKPRRTRPEPEPVSATKSEPIREEGFTFLKGGRPDLSRLIQFYKRAIFGWRDFWMTTSFSKVPVEHSLLVLAGMGLPITLLSGLVSLLRFRFHPTAMVFTLVISSVVILGGSVLGAGVLVLLKKFLRARGDFKSYLCFCAYAFVLSLPLAPLGSLLGMVGMPLTLGFGLFSLWGFSKAFGADLKRMAIAYVGITFLCLLPLVPLFTTYVRLRH